MDKEKLWKCPGNAERSSGAVFEGKDALDELETICRDRVESVRSQQRVQISEGVAAWSSYSLEMSRDV